jgi:hypothetical protein
MAAIAVANGCRRRHASAVVMSAAATAVSGRWPAASGASHVSSCAARNSVPARSASIRIGEVRLKRSRSASIATTVRR